MPDLCLNNSKRTAKRLWLTTTLISLIAIQPVLQAASSAVPTGGNFAAGVGKITSSGNVVNINQSTLRAIIDWNTFSIANGATVNFNNGTGATLNRVNGVASTSILGQLLSSGSVYLINPQGVLISKGATVHTGGDFVASTLNLSNSAFLTNGSLLFSGSSSAGVVNLGTLASSNGNIYLVGHSVQNAGSIAAPNGTTGLAAGSKIVITDASNNQRVEVEAPGGDVTNSGLISAAQVELKSNAGNIYALAGNNGGQINATGTATQDGHVWLIATNGTTNVGGSITAANANGTGGGIETSGHSVNTGSAQIKTGKGGSWLLDPTDLTIDSTLAGTIDASLNGGTNVIEQTSASGTSGTGEIIVANNIAWNGGASLTLSAYKDILFNSGVVISNTGAGNLTLRADNTSTGTGTVGFNNAGQINFSGSTGNVALLYNPSGGYGSPTNYSPNVLTNGSWTAPSDLSVSSQFTAYMLVNSLANLQAVGSNSTTLAGTYALGQNIDISSNTNFIPLGANSPYFTGIFDGRGLTINGLTESDNNTNIELGLFSKIGNSGQVRNLNLTNVSIAETGTNGTNFGALTASNSNVIANVSVAGTITSGVNVSAAGGLVGANYGLIQNSNSSVNINATATTNSPYVGGLVGVTYGTGVVNSSASGAVNIPNSNYGLVGGLIGYNNAPVTNSWATGAVYSGTNSDAGGLIGANYANLTNSYATGAVSAGSGSDLGGLIGLSGSANITNSYATGTVSGTATSAGGLVGYQQSSGGSATDSVVNSYATGNVSDAGSYVGGLIGDSERPVTNSYATGSVTGSTGGVYVGGLLGLSTSTVSSSYATGAVSSPSATSAVGGLIGYDTTGSISNSHATGSVTANNSPSYVGGLIGYNDIALTGSWASGQVQGGLSSGTAADVGGLVGQNDGGGNITSSYATGAVSAGATANVGGLAGEINDAVSSSYATGTVSGGQNANVGGLVGQSQMSGAIAGSYATGAVSGGVSSMSGGLTGYNQAAVSGSYATGSVTGADNSSVGGLSGLNSAAIANSYATGKVVGGTDTASGGLVGESTAAISTSFALGSVSTGTGSSAGGLVGEANANVTDTYAHGAVSGGAGSQLGGLIGNVSAGTVTTSYSSGAVSGTGQGGGLIGENQATVTYSYWDNQTSGFPTTGIAINNGSVTGVSGLTTAQLQSGLLPTNFNSTIWTAPTGGYPFFGWQGSPVTISGTAYNGSSTLGSAGVGVISGGVNLANLMTNSSGSYLVVEPSDIVNSAGVLTFLTSGGTANTFSDGSTGYSNMNLHTSTLSLLSGNSATLSALNTALGTALGSNSGSNILFTLPSGQLSLASGTALSLTTTAPSFTLDQPLTGVSSAVINASGNLSIANAAGITAASGGNITLATGGRFTNNAGANALGVSNGGQWLVYSQNPANDTVAITPGFIQYDATYGVTTPAQSGNGLLYSLAPTLTASLIGTASKVYDGTNAATLSASNVATTGAIQGDTVSVTPSAAIYASSDVNTGIAITASNLTVSAFNGSIPVYGYQLANLAAAGNIGSITPATLTYVAGATSRAPGVSNPIFTGSVTGFVDNQTLASATTGSAVFTSPATVASAAGSYAINGSGLSANNGDYVFVQAPGNASALTIGAPAATTSAGAPITFTIRNTAAVTGQTPTFTAVYNGTPVSGLNVASLVAGLTYQITPTLDGPGVYQVTATGTAPAGYVFNILPGTFTVVDVSPSVLPTQTQPFHPDLPGLLVMPESESEEFLLPFNALGQFRISAGAGFRTFFSGSDSQQTPLASSSFFSGSGEASTSYVAGVKP